MRSRSPSITSRFPHEDTGRREEQASAPDTPGDEPEKPEDDRDEDDRDKDGLGEDGLGEDGPGEDVDGAAVETGAAQGSAPLRRGRQDALPIGRGS